MQSQGSSSTEDLFVFTSESVTEGHPDKLCDQIADTILDYCLKEDPNSKVACQVITKTGLIFIFGEITTKATLNYSAIARQVVRDVGYDDSNKGFDYKTCSVVFSVEKQSEDIAQAVYLNKKEDELGAGDQGLMFGYATDETKELHPLSHLLANQLAQRMAEIRKKGILNWMWPDGKTQVTLDYQIGKEGELIPKRVHSIVISTQHDPYVTYEELRKSVIEHIIKPIVPEHLIDKDSQFIINPSGRFVIGGPKGDAGLTGKKIIVDTYGGWGAHGGGSFSGKDPSKVDRSVSYAARWIAKSIVASKLARRCLVQISYAIGLADPLSIHVNTYGTGKLKEKELVNIIKNNFDLRPYAIIKALDLKKPIFRKTSCYGHFGREEFAWEKEKILKI